MHRCRRRVADRPQPRRCRPWRRSSRRLRAAAQRHTASAPRQGWPSGASDQFRVMLVAAPSLRAPRSAPEVQRNPPVDTEREPCRSAPVRPPPPPLQRQHRASTPSAVATSCCAGVAQANPSGKSVEQGSVRQRRPGTQSAAGDGPVASPRHDRRPHRSLRGNGEKDPDTVPVDRSAPGALRPPGRKMRRRSPGNRRAINSRHGTFPHDLRRSREA